MDLIAVAALTVPVFVVAAGAQAVTGFGFALLAVPLLTLLVGPAPAVAVTTMVALVLTTGAAVSERAHVDGRIALRLVSAALLGMPVGYLVLSRVDERPLRVVIAVVVLALVAVVASGAHIPAGPWQQWGAGMLSGTLLTSTGMNGPPLVLVLHSRGLDARRFRGTLQATFCGQGIVAVGIFLVGGLIAPETWVLAAAGALGVPLGWWLGDRAFRLLPPERFRTAVLGMMIAIAVASLVSVAVL